MSDDKTHENKNVTIDMPTNFASAPAPSEPAIDINAWVREQFQGANKYLAEQGILFDSVITEESRYFAPHIAIWKIKDRQKNLYWVVSGDVPTDAIKASLAANAKEVLRHVSLAWQLKADAILANTSNSQTQIEFANLLINKAEYLYELHTKDDYWS